MYIASNQFENILCVCRTVYTVLHTQCVCSAVQLSENAYLKCNNVAAHVKRTKAN